MLVCLFGISAYKMSFEWLPLVKSKVLEEQKTLITEYVFYTTLRVPLATRWNKCKTRITREEEGRGLFSSLFAEFQISTREVAQSKWWFCETTEAARSLACDLRIFSNWSDGYSSLSDASETQLWGWLLFLWETFSLILGISWSSGDFGKIFRDCCWKDKSTLPFHSGLAPGMQPILSICKPFGVNPALVDVPPLG